MTKNIEVNKCSGREPRRGELNYELRRIMLRHCTKQPLKQSIKSVQLAVARLAKKYGFEEFECKYDRHTSVCGTRSWITDAVEVVVYRKRSGGKINIYRAGATSYPHFYTLKGKSYGNLSAPRDVTVFYGVNEPYAVEKYLEKK